jgi:hypothetical protein
MTAHSRERWRRTRAVLAGFLAIVVLSLGTDEVLHVLKVYPPWGPMQSPALNLLALSYRIVYGIVGGYVTARFAPYAPVRHAVILGIAGSIVSSAGAVATIPLNLGPAWYPIALVLTSLPCAGLGGALEVWATRRPYPYTSRSPGPCDSPTHDFAAPSSSA